MSLADQLAALMAAEDRESILAEADRLVNGDRQRDYGHPAQNLGRIAAMWSAILGVEVEARQVGLCMAALKIAREVATPKRDNLVDACGYLRMVEMTDVLEEASS